jgi:hypothetical protein
VYTDYLIVTPPLPAPPVLPDTIALPADSAKRDSTAVPPPR